MFCANHFIHRVEIDHIGTEILRGCIEKSAYLLNSMRTSWIYLYAAQLTLPFASAVSTAATRGLTPPPPSEPLPYVTSLQVQGSRLYFPALYPLSAMGEAYLKPPKLSKGGKKRLLLKEVKMIFFYSQQS